MAQSTTVLAQIQKLVPKKLFVNLALCYHVNKHATVFKAPVHFSTLLFAQLTGLKSTRDVQHATASVLVVDNLVQVKKSTLADANERISWHFYHDLFQELFSLYRPLLGGHNFQVPGNLLSLDSTLITVCLEYFPWAKYRNYKGALKLHTLLDHDNLTPRDIIMTNGKVSDIEVARTMKIEAGSTYLVDRGYFDSSWFYEIHTRKAFFVTRMKSNIGFEYTDKRKVKPKTGVKGDWIGNFIGTPDENYPDPLRLIHFVDPETGKELEFLTNLLDLEADEIAELYKQRWQIELFFKWIKQNLKIKKFLGTSENAVLSQIWVAMITFLLLKVIASSSNNAITTHQILIFVRTHALVKVPLSQAWQEFQRTKTTRKQQRKIQTRKIII